MSETYSRRALAISPTALIRQQRCLRHCSSNITGVWDTTYFKEIYCSSSAISATSWWQIGGISVTVWRQISNVSDTTNFCSFFTVSTFWNWIRNLIRHDSGVQMESIHGEKKEAGKSRATLAIKWSHWTLEHWYQYRRRHNCFAHWGKGWDAS